MLCAISCCYIVPRHIEHLQYRNKIFPENFAKHPDNWRYTTVPWTYTIILAIAIWNGQIIYGHDEGIDTEFEVMAVTPQTPKYHHNRGVAEVVVTFGSLWCHSHDRKQGINYASAFRRRRHYVFGLSVRPSVRPSEAWNTLFWPEHRSVGPPDQPLPFYGMSVRPSVRLSVRPSGEVSGHLPENAWRD